MFDRLIASLKELSSRGNLEKAFGIFSHIRHQVSSSDYDINVRALSSLLVVCANRKSLIEGEQLHAQIIYLGLTQHPSLISKLANLYSVCNFLYDAHAIAQESLILHPVPWNVVISAYVKNRHFNEALSAYRQMLEMGVRPDQFTYTSVLKACGELLDIDLGREIHGCINASGCYDRCLYVQNALISIYGKVGKAEIAREIFDKVLEKDAVCWNAMISAYAAAGMWEKAIELFESMLEQGVGVNIVTWKALAGLHLGTDDFEGLLQSVRACGIRLDDVGMTISLTACSRIQALKSGKEIHACAIISGFDECEYVKSALITMYSRCKHLKHAYLVFRVMEGNKSTITWNPIISGFASDDRFAETYILFREMLLSGLEPDNVTLASVLPICARASDLQHGKEIHCYITKRQGFQDHSVLWNSLIDMYARSGKIVDAKKVFDLLSKKDKYAYASLIAGYGIQGQGIIAVELFEEMIRCGIEPDHITMVAVLSACSRSRLLAQGQLLFDKMWSVYRIKPCLEHYSCMVNLFGRTGLLNKALQTMRTMPFQPTPELWVNLIKACCDYRNTELGELAAQRLMQMRPDTYGYYVLIADMYDTFGRYKELQKVKPCMKETKKLRLRPSRSIRASRMMNTMLRSSLCDI